MKKKSKGEILLKILQVAKRNYDPPKKTGAGWTFIVKKSGLTQEQGEKYVGPLIEKEYLVGPNGEIGKEHSREYHPSQKGLSLKKDLKNLKAKFRELGLATE